MDIDRKSLLLTIVSYTVWGVAPLYWALIAR